MPSASRPSFTHFTIRAMPKLYALEKDLRAALPVVERLLLLGQRLDVGGAEALLQEPVRGVGGQREDAPQPETARPLLAGLEQPLAVAFLAIAVGHREAGELGALVVGIRIQRGAADDHAVVLDHQEVADLGLDQLAAALHQQALGLARLAPRQHAAP